MDEGINKPFLDPEVSSPHLKVFGDLARGTGERIQQIPILKKWAESHQLPEKLEKLGLATSRAFIPEFMSGPHVFRSSEHRYAGPGITLALEGLSATIGGATLGPIGAVGGYLVGRAAILGIITAVDRMVTNRDWS